MNRFTFAWPSRAGLVSLIVSVSVSDPAGAIGCACCSDNGMRVERVDQVTDYHRDQLRGMDFAKEAELFMTDAGEDGVKGISSIAETCQLTVKQDDKQWRLTFLTPDGKTGVLTLPIPAKLGTFQVDPRNGRKSAGGGPLLYKEWRWAGVPKAEGIFKKNAQRFSLIFQGSGNRCDNGSDFSHWRLEVAGKDISYAFFGDFAPQNVKEE